MSDENQTVEVPVSVLVRWHQRMYNAEVDLIEGRDVSGYVRVRDQREEFEDFNDVIDP